MTEIKKNIVYALGLLFSFLIIMVHDAMPHSHNDKDAYCIEALGGQLGHCPSECENESENFPIHHHSSIDKTYYFFRSNSVEVDDNNFVDLFKNIEIPQYEIILLKPLFINKTWTDNNVCSSPFYFPITFSHRGPPSFLF